MFVWLLYLTKVKVEALSLCIQAKDAALAQEKWLLVNLQSTKEFSSLMVMLCLFRLPKVELFLYAKTTYSRYIFCCLQLNRDTWGNEAVSQIISVNFIFWQVSILFKVFNVFKHCSLLVVNWVYLLECYNFMECFI